MPGLSQVIDYQPPGIFTFFDQEVMAGILARFRRGKKAKRFLAIWALRLYDFPLSHEADT
jgi:hypothetical protein